MDTLGILLPQDFSSVQRANASDISQRSKVVSSHHLEVHPRDHGGPRYTSENLKFNFLKTIKG